MIARAAFHLAESEGKSEPQGVLIRPLRRRSPQRNAHVPAPSHPVDGRAFAAPMAGLALAIAMALAVAGAGEAKRRPVQAGPPRRHRVPAALTTSCAESQRRRLATSGRWATIRTRGLAASALAEHWTGTSWKVVHTPSPGTIN